LYTAQPIIIIEMLRLFISRFSVWSQTFDSYFFLDTSGVYKAIRVMYSDSI